MGCYFFLGQLAQLVNVSYHGQSFLFLSRVQPLTSGDTMTNDVTRSTKWRKIFILDFNVESVVFPINQYLIIMHFDKSISTKMRA